MYINSSNEDLDLSKGQLSQLLLKACGQQLQDDCKDYAPLKPGAVAVTDARNLKCKYIFHIALPDYKNRGSERVGVTCLCVAVKFVGYTNSNACMSPYSSVMYTIPVVLFQTDLS